MNLWPFNREKRDAGNDASWAAMMGSAVSASGQFVDAKAAEGISAVFGCVQALSESTACLPLHVYARAENGDRERVPDHPLARVLNEPNPYQSGMAFRESMTASVLMQGNGYARKEINGAGELSAMYPLHAPSVSVVRLPSGCYAYDWTDTDGKRIRLLQDEVFHLRDRSEAGSYVGKSRIAIARDTLGLALAQRAHGSGVFRSGARPSGVLESDRPLSAEQHTSLTAIIQQHTGTGNAGGSLVLPKGITFKPLSMNLEDAQWIAAQQFSVDEVCRIFRVPPILVQELTHATFTNVIELGQQFVRYSLQRWLTLWESEISRSLLGPIARRRYYAEHSVEGLLRGNPEARADFYGKAIKDGWMTVDEVRKLENLPQLAEKSLQP